MIACATGHISPARESLRRQMRSGGLPAGSSRALRLDPFALPVRFAASDAAADERVRHVELYRERVVVRRSLRGMRMALNMPVSAFAGVAIQLMAGEGGAQAAVAVVLEHKIRRWCCRCSSRPKPTRPWPNGAPGRNVLGLPLLVAEDDGALREPFARMGGVRIERARPRRRRRNAIKRRRPSMLLRRRAAQAHRRNAGASRRARDHRQKLDLRNYLQRCSLSVPPCCCCISIWSASTWRSV